LVPERGGIKDTALESYQAIATCVCRCLCGCRCLYSVNLPFLSVIS